MSLHQRQTQNIPSPLRAACSLPGLSAWVALTMACGAPPGQGEPGVESNEPSEGVNAQYGSADHEATSDGPAHWYRLENDAVDSARGLDGTLRNGAIFSADSARGDYVLVLDGTDDHVEIADNASLDVGLGDFSVTVWFRRQPSQTENLRIVSKGIESGYSIWASDTKVHASLGNGTSRKYVGGIHGGVGAWSHVGLSMDRDGALQLYINGKAAKTVEISDWAGANLDSTHEFAIGRDSVTNGLNWRGSIDDVRIYHRTLDPLEVAEMAAGAPTSNSTTPPGDRMNVKAQPAVRPAGAPKYSDVSFRYGWTREVFPTVEDAKAALEAFHATRVDWFYPGAPDSSGPTVTPRAQEFIDWVHANDMEVIGAMNPHTRNEAWSVAMGNFGRFMGDPANADYVAEAVAWGQAQIAAGVDALLVDNFFNYRSSEHQRQFRDNVVRIIKETKPGFQIAANHGHHIRTDFVTGYDFDFHFSDSNFEPAPGQWWREAGNHRQVNSAIISHPNILMSETRYRTQIALAYANGAHVTAPWDRFIDGGGDREFGAPENYADVYAFARSLGQHGFLDGYEDAAVGGYDLSETRYAVPPLEIVSGNSSVSLFARARPGDASAAVVVHVVKWAGSGDTTLRLRNGNFFGGAPLTLRLWTRKPYDAAEHARVATNEDYTSLKWDRTSALTVTGDGEWTTVVVPELYPWGVLVVGG